jgi:hypothetical protein
MKRTRQKIRMRTYHLGSPPVPHSFMTTIESRKGQLEKGRKRMRESMRKRKVRDKAKEKANHAGKLW